MRNLDGRSKLYALFASPCEHSLSPLIHNSAFEKMNINAAYMAFDVNLDRIADAVYSMRTLGISGANVSMPNKTAILKYLDEISDEARFCNAVNTVVNRDGKLYGYNTDIFGAEKAIEKLGVEIKNSKICLLGLGGAGQAVLYALAKNKAKKVCVFVRDLSIDKRKVYVDKICSSFPLDVEIYSIENTQTSLGMGQDIDKSPLGDEIKLPKHICVLDLIYNPLETALLSKAAEDGCKTFSNGISMLAYQGAKAFEYFTEKQIYISDIFCTLENAFKF